MAINKPNPREYYCYYCKEWLSVDYITTHFAQAHDQSKVTLEVLKQRWSIMGGLDIRDPTEQLKPDDTKIEKFKF